MLFAADSIANGAVFPTWMSDTRFWYERQIDDDTEYCVVDASDGRSVATVRRTALASALASHLDAPVSADDLLVVEPRFDPDASTLTFSAFGESYAYTLASGTLAPAKKIADSNWAASPDGSRAVLLRDFNLWLRDINSEDERALTTDGSEFYAYGDTPAAMRGVRGRIGDKAPEAIWSPDGRWLLTLQTDDRHVPDLPLTDYVPADGVRPKISANRTSLPADPKVTEFRIIAIDVETGRQVEARYPRLSAVRMNTTPFGSKLTWWSADSRTAFFVDLERGEKAAHVIAFDVATGATRVVFSEQADSYVELSVNVYAAALVYPLAATNELVWYSERSGRGHLYLYDLETGACRNAVTTGDWQIRQVLRVDAGRREVFFLAAGIAPDENPYVCKPCIASLDAGEVRIISAGPGDHRVWSELDVDLMVKKVEGLNSAAISGLSPSGAYFVETVSRVNSLPITYLRDRDGREIAILERAVGDLPEGWQWPEPVKCTASDGETVTYGLLFMPLGREPGQRYPLIDLVYGGPQTSNVPHSSFADGSLGAATYLDAAHLSALGAFVLILDGRGTANREQVFRTASYRAAHTASNLDDHVAAIRQLSGTRPDIDPDRIGVTGFSGGGFMTAHAAMRFGDVFKVAVAGGGNYDQALFWHSWGERYHGPHEPGHYAVQAAKTYAEGLKGKLLLVHGLRDDGCHPAGLFQLIQALIDANKNYDLVVIPRAGHDWTGYGQRRRLDYFVAHLFGDTPPAAEAFERPHDRLLKKIEANAKTPDRAS